MVLTWMWKLLKRKVARLKRMRAVNNLIIVKHEQSFATILPLDARYLAYGERKGSVAA